MATGSGTKVPMTNSFPPAEPHDDIEEIFPDTFMVTGSRAFKPLVTLPRIMVIIRNGEELTLVNAVRLSDEGLAALDTLGTVKHIIRIGSHGMDNAFYLDRYDAKMWALPGMDHAAGITVDVEMDANTELPVPGLSLFLFENTKVAEGALLLDRSGGLAITCDSVQHWVPSHFLSLAAKLITKLMGFQNPAQIGPPWSKKQTREGISLKPDFERLASLPFKHLVGAHGGLLRDNAPEHLKATIARFF